VDRSADIVLRLGPSLDGTDQSIDRALQILQIRRTALVQDHDVDGKPLQTPVFECAKQLPHDADVAHFIDAQQHDRQIARDPASPQRGYVAPAALERLDRRPKRGIGEQDAASEALEQVRFVGPDAEVVKLSLRMRPGKRVDALAGGRPRDACRRDRARPDAFAR
jgi:hypothetical protein